MPNGFKRKRDDRQPGHTVLRTRVGLDAEVATVDGFQGREREGIILNLVARSPVKFVEDAKRLNVALSRPSRSRDTNFWKDQKQQAPPLAWLAQAAIDQNLVIKYEPSWLI